MAQYINKSALVAEIERRIKVRDFQMKSGCWVSSTYMYEDLLDFLDTLEVKEIGADLGDPQGDIGVNWVQEEAVSNDLEKAAHLYVDTSIEYFDSEGNPCCYSAFLAGAQWQKEQMIDWLKENKDHPLIGCEDPCLSGYLTDRFIEEFKKAMEDKL